MEIRSFTVQYDAGGSYNPSLGDEGYRAYVFDTDKGTWKFPLLKVLQMNLIFQQIKSWPR